MVRGCCAGAGLHRVLLAICLGVRVACAAARLRRSETGLAFMTFSFSSLLFGLLLMACALLFGVLSVRFPDLWRRLPRARIPGAFIGGLCLVWSAFLIIRMLEGDLSRYHSLVKLAVPVLGIAAYFYLDYLFARSLGGLLVLMVSHLLQGAFAQDVPLRPLYSLCCYAIGLAGLFLIALPWLFRDWLEKAGTRRAWRHTLSAVCTLFALVLVLFAFLRG